MPIPYQRVALVFAFLSFVPVMGIIFGIVAFYYISRYRHVWQSDRAFWNARGIRPPRFLPELLTLIGTGLNLAVLAWIASRSA
ncbi:MAG: hypothetical protein JSW71_04545 [Gemmatimonadota bacterium]|nr:MAG: hypothetical protein JSW71_04545 [Gemmatimonadota bacterium]